MKWLLTVAVFVIGMIVLGSSPGAGVALIIASMTVFAVLFVVFLVRTLDTDGLLWLIVLLIGVDLIGGEACDVDFPCDE